MTMRDREILARTIGIQKENWGESGIFFLDNLATIILKSSKIQSNVWRFLSKLKLS